MNREFLNIEGVSNSAHPSSSGVVVGDVVFVDSFTSSASGGDIRADIDSAIDRVDAVLGQAGCSLGDLAKVNCYVVDSESAALFTTMLRSRLGDGPYPPVVFQIADLWGAERVFIDAIAVIPALA